MKQEISNALADIAQALDSSNPGHFVKHSARLGLERVKTALEAGGFELTQKEFLAEDLKALAEGMPVKTDLAKAVEARIAGLL